MNVAVGIPEVIRLKIRGGVMNLYDDIARVAYELFEKKGRRHGCDLEDWLEAETIIMLMRYQTPEGSITTMHETEKPKRQRKTAAGTVKMKATKKAAAPADTKPKRSTRKKKAE